jgi:hypothetical protein
LKRRGAGTTLWAARKACGNRNRMWNEPYLETCCRSALHRLMLVAPHGRPTGLKDGPCLERLEAMGFARLRSDGRFEVTEAGAARHDSEILRKAG